MAIFVYASSEGSEISDVNECIKTKVKVPEPKAKTVVTEGTGAFAKVLKDWKTKRAPHKGLYSSF